MTLILVIPASDGIVFASDGQLTAGMIRFQGKKIKSLNKYCLWSASGEMALIQRVEESFASLQIENPLNKLRDDLAKQIKESVSSLLELDFRTGFFQTDPDKLLKLHPGDFVFVECRGDDRRILHITIDGTPEWIETPFATGVGGPFAYALLQRYQGVDIDVSEASLLAYRVIEETIEVGAYGLGPPIDVWQITKDGCKNCSEEEISALTDAARSLREAEIRLFLQEEKP